MRKGGNIKLKTVVTGGAGFIGCNLVDQLMKKGHEVFIYDNLSRAGVEKNVTWLKQKYQESIYFIEGDIRDYAKFARVVDGADVIYHLAAQVAVTNSVMDPLEDFEINALGTLNVLEAARKGKSNPILVFTSTNKVYGGLQDIKIIDGETRWQYRELYNGIDENRSLDFHTPYGCSKGAADQYVRDYARIYDLRTVVFRMSCIYGPRQFGTEDQGWLAHFIISVIKERPLIIYGDGKQVRDILYIEDLVNALQLAVDRIDVTAGQVYNIGGGLNNTISIWCELETLLSGLCRREIPVTYDSWRPGDQTVYISDITKAQKYLRWEPIVDKVEGIKRLYQWIKENHELVE